MKILLVNQKNANDIGQFSGTSYFMAKAIKELFEEVSEYNDFEVNDIIPLINKGLFKRALEPAGKRLTRHVKNCGDKFDFVLCQGGNSVIPFYNAQTPIVFWHDSTWSTLAQSYTSTKAFKRFKEQYKYFYLWDKKALERADILIFSSDFIAEACHTFYKIPYNKIHVVPFGANFELVQEPDQLVQSLNKRLDGETLQLTFIGKDWQRKGLIKAVQVTSKLNNLGIKAILNVVGCEPSLDIYNSRIFNIVGIIDKSDAANQEKFMNIMEETHFLIHPTNSEPFGIVICEANAYGIPVIGTNVEGLKTTVRNGKNGFVFKKNKFVNEAFTTIKHLTSNFKSEYTALFNNSLAEYKNRLNWTTSASRVKEILSMYQ